MDDLSLNELQGELGKLLPVLPMCTTVVFPQSVATVQIDGEANNQLLTDYPDSDALVVLAFAELDEKSKGITKDMLAPIGVVARILSRMKASGSARRVTFQGLERVRILAFEGETSYFKALVEPLPDMPGDPVSIVLHTRRAITLYEELCGISNKYPRDLLSMMRQNTEHAGRFSDLIAASLRFDFADRLKILQCADYAERLSIVLKLLGRELEKARITQEVERRVKEEIEESRREYYLRQQIKAIRKELGDEELGDEEADKFRAQLKELNLGEDIEREVVREIERLRHIQPSSSEYQVIATFLERFFALPWGKTTPEEIDLPHVLEVLDAGHYGLTKVKERILEFLAVRKLNPDRKGAILCFSGPPGVGKTSLGRAIADAIGRKFFRISVGGVHDEAEIRGHRRTYIGALPGKILNGITRAGTMNPLLMIDELDKLASDHRGDPSSALLEVLDPEQNDTFTDHYFNVPFDLSKVLFIVNANNLHAIPGPLQDRLEVISIEGYTEKEKIEIARRHILPKVNKDHGLDEKSPTYDAEAISQIIRFWTHEAGVRNLQRCFEKISRKIARARVERGDDEGLHVTVDDLETYLGPKRYLQDDGMGQNSVGVANGLAWTAAGGEVLIIEIIKMPGHGKLVLTGQLGEVMKESVHAAHSLIRSRADMLGLSADAFENMDIHVHFPAGAIPKDGPSAGVTVSVAMASLFSGLLVRSDFAMTGEITLRGKVLPVGGIKDKLLAAYRAGIRNVALPKDNERDLAELPEDVRADMTVHLISQVEELWAKTLIGYDDLLKRAATTAESGKPAKSRTRRKKAAAEPTE